MRGGSERSFGFSVGLVVGLLAVWAAWRQRPVAGWWLGSAASGLVILGWLWPSALRIPSRLWWRLAQGLGWLNARLLLSVFFFLVVTPTGLVMRLGGWDPLRRRRTSRGSGWVPSPARLRHPKHYERMY